MQVTSIRLMLKRPQRRAQPNRFNASAQSSLEMARLQPQCTFMGIKTAMHEKSKVYFVGGGIGSLAAAAFMIRVCVIAFSSG